MADIRFAFSVTGTDNRMVFEIIARCLRPASMQSGGGTIPIVLVGYDLEQLEILNPFFTCMRERKADPRIYVWDIETASPEILVWFELKDPPRGLMRRLAGSRHRTTIGAIPAWDTMLTAAAANFGRAETHAFLELCDATQAAGVYVIEDRDADVPAARSVHVDPLHTFATQHVHRHRPPSLIS